MAATVGPVASTPKSARSQAASLQFFGASEDKPTVSPWFHPEDLNAPNFDAATYVSELKQYAPLESLSEELRSHLGTLKAKVQPPLHYAIPFALHTNKQPQRL